MPRTGRGPECDQEDRKITSPSNETHYGRTRVAREAGGGQCVSNRLYTYTRRLRVAASTECVEMARPVGPGRVLQLLVPRRRGTGRCQPGGGDDDDQGRYTNVVREKRAGDGRSAAWPRQKARAAWGLNGPCSRGGRTWGVRGRTGSGLGHGQVEHSSGGEEQGRSGPIDRPLPPTRPLRCCTDTDTLNLPPISPLRASSANEPLPPALPSSSAEGPYLPHPPPLCAPVLLSNRQLNSQRPPGSSGGPCVARPPLRLATLPSPPSSRGPSRIDAAPC